jgi:hypothetical protein
MHYLCVSDAPEGADIVSTRSIAGILKWAETSPTDCTRSVRRPNGSSATLRSAVARGVCCTVETRSAGRLMLPTRSRCA